MKNLLKQTVLLVLYWLYKVMSLFYHPQIVVVLMYHSISFEKRKFAAPPNQFERQICYLIGCNFSFITARDLYQWFEEIQTLPTKSVLVTFDDGYRDFKENALPILKKYNAGATVFIHANRSSLPLGNELPLLDWEDLKKISMEGIELGDHSYSHPNMKLLDADEATREMEDSRRTFQEHVGFRPDIFAYPGGKFSNSLAGQLKQEGYHAAFSIDRGLVHYSQNSFAIKRFGISRDTSFLEFKARLTPVSDWYETLVKLLNH